MKLVKKTNKGFGIAETLIASTIIMMIIFALTAAGRSALRSSQYLQERTQASYLAQGGIEQMRQIRDSNWLDSNASGTEWSSFALTTTAAKGYSWDSSNKLYSTLNFDTTQKRYKLSTPTVTLPATPDVIPLDSVDFSRTVILQQIQKDQTGKLLPTDGTAGTKVEADINSIKVTVKIDWSNNGHAKNLSISEILTNWRPNY